MCTHHEPQCMTDRTLPPVARHGIDFTFICLFYVLTLVILLRENSVSTVCENRPQLEENLSRPLSWNQGISAINLIIPIKIIISENNFRNTNRI